LSYADHIFEVVGFDGLEGVDNVAANPLYDEHHGLLKVLKIPSVSGLNLAPISRPLTCDWTFKVKRRQFVLQHLALPPCLSEDASRSNQATPQSICTAAIGEGNSVLDF
uniref:Elongator complex protein 4 n=1 Tax=Hymenolepis diminuta TaxID=6216 RepID=A0A0R3SLB4_HYMDI